MKVCACCYNPQDEQSQLGLDFWYGIEVPDDTPKDKNGRISHEILLKSGMQWDGKKWLTPSGEYYLGAYQISGIKK